MVNSDRIVPITKIDYLSLIATVLKIASVTFDVIESDTEGNFVAEGSGDVGNLLAAQPVKSFDFASGVTAGVVYFCADYAYEGFSANGVALSATVEPEKDGVSLYTATLSSGSLTIAKVTP
jgi:hypothetical protein